MIMIHDPNLLIKLIIRMIVRKLGIRHAGMILFEPIRNSYVLKISRGEHGVKIPEGFTRFDRESPIIQLFQKREYRPLTVNRNAIVADDLNRMIWRESVIDNGNGIKELLTKVDQQMQMLNSIACVPAFYQDKLMAILLLGEKQDATKFEQEELDFFAALASDTAMAIRNAQLFTGLKREAERNRELFIKTISVLGSTIEAKDAYTHGHTERVTHHAVEVAKQMHATGVRVFDETFFENLYIGGLLHDIGKIAVPEAILNKEGKLTDQEYEIMKSHTVRGAEIVRPLGLPQECVDVIRNHHEAYDGRGYPDGLKGEDIPMLAAVLAVADTFDAMTTDRPYRKGLTREVALAEIKKFSGKQFHPLCAQALIELYEEGRL